MCLSVFSLVKGQQRIKTFMLMFYLRELFRHRQIMSIVLEILISLCK